MLINTLTQNLYRQHFVNKSFDIDGHSSLLRDYYSLWIVPQIYISRNQSLCIILCIHLREFKSYDWGKLDKFLEGKSGRK